MRFYVYEHWRPDKDTCFWVGKGKGARARSFRRNSRYDRVVAKLARLGMCVEVRMVADALDEAEAFRIERERIAFWRAQGDELCNMTDGGEGVSGLKMPTHVVQLLASRKRGSRHSAETRAKMSASHLGKPKTEEHRRSISVAKTGKPQGPHTPEHNAKISASARGRKDGDEVRAKKRAAAALRPPLTPESRKKISESVSDLWKDRKYRDRLIAAHSQRAPISEATRAKMRAAQAARRKAELEGAG